VAEAKKNAERLRAHLVFIDESSFSQTPSVRQTWAPKGKTPVLSHRWIWKRYSAIGALSYKGETRRALIQLIEGSAKTPAIVGFLKHLRRHLRGKVIVIWDGAQTHRAVAVREAADSYGWQLERLPPYSPDLNPVEGWWSWMKGGPLANFAGETLKDVGREVRGGARRVQRRPDLISAFLAKTGLSL
jgi:hypothetical protein